MGVGELTDFMPIEWTKLDTGLAATKSSACSLLSVEPSPFDLNARPHLIFGRDLHDIGDQTERHHFSTGDQSRIGQPPLQTRENFAYQEFHPSGRKA